MVYDLELNLFRFDAHTDYLPYYKRYFIKIDRDKTLNQLLYKIKKGDRSLGYPRGKNSAIAINGKNLYTTTKIADIVAHFGNKFTLLPLSQKRAKKDLKIDDSDFLEKFKD